MYSAQEEFYQSARTHARRWTRRFDVTMDHAEECEQMLVVILALKPAHPPRWTWPKHEQERYLCCAARNHAINYRASIQDYENRMSHCTLDGDGSDTRLDVAALESVDSRLMCEIVWDSIYACLSE